MKKIIRSYKTILVLLTIALLSTAASLQKQSFQKPKDADVSEIRLSEVLVELGESKPAHSISAENLNNATLIEKGRQLVFEGRSLDPDGKKSKRISNFFNCTHCHNTVIEDPDLTKSDPEARLDFVIAQGKPLLPATTFYGLVNRTTFYNDDYAKKYGKLVEPARNNLVNAMQLCATECAQGRSLQQWEIDALLAYFYSIEYKISDLKLSADEFSQLKQAYKTNNRVEENVKKEVRDMLRSKFFNASPATFVSHNDKGIRKYGEAGNPENGRKIYSFSCMNCHKSVGGVTNLKLDMEKVTFRFLERNLKKNNHFSVYYMVRKGTYAVPGYRPYMPNFSQERLSSKQMEDLVAFIKQQAK